MLDPFKSAIVKEISEVDGHTKDQKELLKLADKSGAATLAAVTAAIKLDQEAGVEARRKAVVLAIVHVVAEAGIKLAIVPAGHKRGRKAGGDGRGAAAVGGQAPDTAENRKTVLATIAAEDGKASGRAITSALGAKSGDILKAMVGDGTVKEIVKAGEKAKFSEA